jgi:hypothetical protein
VLWEDDNVPVVVTNLPVYYYSIFLGSGLIWDGQGAGATNVGTWNSNLASLVAEYTDGRVVVADVATPSNAYDAQLNGAINTTPVGGTVETWNYDNAGASWPATAGFKVKLETETMWVQAMTGTTITVIRGHDSSTPTTHADNTMIRYGGHYLRDNVHLSPSGASLWADTISTAISTLPATTVTQARALQGSQAMHRVRNMKDGTYIGPRGTRSTLVLVNGTMYGTPVEITTPVVINELHCEVTSGGSAGSVVRLSIHGDSWDGSPGVRQLDAGTAVSTGTGDISITGLWKLLRPGWYWFAVSSQGAPATPPTLRSVTTLASAMNIFSLTSPTGANDPVGYSAGTNQTGATTAATAWSSAFGCDSVDGHERAACVGEDLCTAGGVMIQNGYRRSVYGCRCRRDRFRCCPARLAWCSVCCRALVSYPWVCARSIARRRKPRKARLASEILPRATVSALVICSAAMVVLRTATRLGEHVRWRDRR